MPASLERIRGSPCLVQLSPDGANSLPTSTPAPSRVDYALLPTRCSLASHERESRLIDGDWRGPRRANSRLRCRHISRGAGRTVRHDRWVLPHQSAHEFPGEVVNVGAASPTNCTTPRPTPPAATTTRPTATPSARASRSSGPALPDAGRRARPATAHRPARLSAVRSHKEEHVPHHASARKFTPR